jgi:hypothetical protein
MCLRSGVAVWAILLALWTAAAASTMGPQTGVPRLVAVGDVHGAASGLTDILRAAGLIDADARWTGGTARLVQTGDFTDRGDDVRRVMDLFMRLEGEARRAGGRVDVLFGNHEGMNVLHDLRDVSPRAYAAFADGRSEDRRRKAFEAHLAIAKRAGGTLVRDEWMGAHPAGFVEYVQEMSASGRYGRWIRARKAVLQIGDSIFMHAGLHPDSTASVDEVNRTVEREVRVWDDVIGALERAKIITPTFTLQEIVGAAQVEIGRIAVGLKSGEPLGEHVTQHYITQLQQLTGLEKWALLVPEGPLWYRGLATLPDTAQPSIETLLQRHRAARFVLGHTPQLPGRITTRFGGRVVLIDTGMLVQYFKGGQPSAIEISDGKITAIYVSGREAIGTNVGRGLLN